MLIISVIALAAYALFGNVILFKGGLILIILLGTFGYILIGILVATFNMQIKTRGRLLSVLLFPLLVPLLLAAVNASSLMLMGGVRMV